MSQLPQNFAPNAIPVNVIRDFIRYAEKANLNLNSDLEWNAAWGKFAAKQYQSDAQLRRDVGPYSDAGNFYPDGPFTWQVNDILSGVTANDNGLAGWLPTTKTNTRKEVVAHLEDFAPNNWNGTNFAAFLASQNIAECEYGYTSKYNTFSYEIGYGTYSVSTKTFKVEEQLVMQREYENSPMFYLRGDYAGLQIEDDVDFAVAIVGRELQRLTHWNLIYGKKSNSQMEFDGLLEVLTPGYVGSRVIAGSSGTVTGWAKPVTLDGSLAAYSTVSAKVQALRNAIRFIRDRAGKRGSAINNGDMALVMPLSAWHAIAEHLATESMVSIPNANIYVRPTEAEDRLSQIMSGGFGQGSFVVDGQAVPVIIEDGLGLMNNTKTTITTPILLLTRRINGMPILEQQYIDWSKANSHPINQYMNANTLTIGLGGIARVGWEQENSECFYYWGKMGGRLVSRYQPYQFVFSNCTFNLTTPFENEATIYTNNFASTVMNGGTLWLQA